MTLLLVRSTHIYYIMCLRAACLVFCSQSVKDRVSVPSFSESECKGTTFFHTGKIFHQLFSRKMRKKRERDKKVEKKGNGKGKMRRKMREKKGRDTVTAHDTKREVFFLSIGADVHPMGALPLCLEAGIGTFAELTQLDGGF